MFHTILLIIFIFKLRLLNLSVFMGLKPKVTESFKVEIQELLR